MTKLAGSYGKRTSINSSDIDIVIFIKGEYPPFTNVLAEFCKILRGKVENIKQTKYSLQFNIGSLEIDLLPATDLVPENKGAHDLIQRQQQRTLDIIASVPRSQQYGYSSSLAFSVIDFMKCQSGFAHEMVRLAKLWYKSVCMTTYVSGAKYAMELMAVNAANCVREGAYYTAFQRFLQTIEDFSDMNIVFDYTFDEISENHWPSESSTSARLIDPANPYNNLVRGFFAKKGVIKKLREEARRTLDALAKYRRWKFDEVCSSYIIDIFYPNIFDLVDCGQIHFEKCPADESRDVIIRCAADDFTRKQLEFIAVYLISVCNDLCDSADGDDDVDGFIDDLLWNVENRNIVELDNDEYYSDDFNVSIAVPTPVGTYLLSFDLQPDTDDEDDDDDY